jgi:predicted dehydrogenase
MTRSYVDFACSSPRPVVILGAGGIVRDAHLPAYRTAGFPVYGVYNRTVEKAAQLAAQWDIPHVYSTVEQAVQSAPENAVFDLALMPEQFAEVLSLLPEGAPVLIQKPLGHSLEQARQLVDICEQRHLVAAVNTQLRFAGFVLRARAALESGALGDLFDMEIRVVVHTPWLELFPNVAMNPRLEIAQHSVHYIDLIRSFLGDPVGVSAVSARHPSRGTSGTRSTIVMHYGDTMRASVSSNHDHDFGPEEQESFIKWEGTEGAIKANFGLLMDYPKGRPDRYREWLRHDRQWREPADVGTWFPDAFIGSMGALQRYVAGDDPELPTSVQDVLHTMACVEAAYSSHDTAGVALAQYLAPSTTTEQEPIG